MDDLRARRRCPDGWETVGRVYLAPEGEPLDFEVVGGYARIALPRSGRTPWSYWSRALALTDDAITNIKQMILSGQVGPGELPREKARDQARARAAPCGEAVRALILAGVLKTRQGDGTYVTSLEPASSWRP